MFSKKKMAEIPQNILKFGPWDIVIFAGPLFLAIRPLMSLKAAPKSPK